ncbi:SDR family oxidoreductase [Spongiibacter sp. KMU-166]|uniref:SDR family oxidoreductase n=1 Tax=Spongiibacter thalassae TaxID=2721624 RepID=A0ABX1GC29_9GAMM|nr:SDR family oxidoreductase [Spongiibacter thalassae]NKI16729.1 SDR family oxidoreductase [Spongiibacter thalassae]
MPNQYVSQSRVLVTGAAGGLGRSLALAYGRRGWKVAVCDIDRDGLEAVAQQLRSVGSEVLAAHCNVTVDNDLTDLCKRCEKEWGGLDVLINNAGIASMAAIHKEPMERWQRLIDINLLGVVRGCHSFVPLFRKQGGGHIVNIASIAGIANTPFMAAYNATKAAVISVSETLLVELAPSNIGVTVVCPAMFKTGIAQRAPIDNPELRNALEAEMAKSPISAEDIAEQAFSAVQRKQFLLIPHRASRWQWRIKRISSSLYRRLFLKY